MKERALRLLLAQHSSWCGQQRASSSPRPRRSCMPHKRCGLRSDLGLSLQICAEACPRWLCGRPSSRRLQQAPCERGLRRRAAHLGVQAAQAAARDPRRPAHLAAVPPLQQRPVVCCHRRSSHPHVSPRCTLPHALLRVHRRPPVLKVQHEDMIPMQ